MNSSLDRLDSSASSSFLVASCRALSSRRPQARQADQATQETERLGDEFRRFMHLVVALDSSALRRDRPHDNVLQASLNAIIRLVVSSRVEGQTDQVVEDVSLRLRALTAGLNRG